MCADRIVIPTSLRKRMLKEFHVGHPGISKMKSQIKCYTYWPKMDEDIQNLVRSCRGCALAAKSPPIKFQPWPKTDILWSRLYLYFAALINSAYNQVIVDSCTKCPEILKSKRPTTTEAINLHEIFTSFGVPDSFVSDNGGQFTSSCCILTFDPAKHAIPK